MKRMSSAFAVSGLIVAAAIPANAKQVESFDEFFAEGDAGLNFRYRLELVEQDGFAKNATASTLLTTLWYRTAEVKGFSAYLEGTRTTTVGKNSFNSTTNGVTDRPVVADPQVAELSQAYLQYEGKDLTLRAGRQIVAFDNQRFIGAVAFRQNDQTFDAVTAKYRFGRDVTATYGHLWTTRRVVGKDNPLGVLDTNSHVVNVRYDGLGFGSLTGYAYLVDQEDPQVQTLSSATYGLRFAGKKAMSQELKLSYELEYAVQSDYKGNPTDYKADYFHAAVTGDVGDFSVGGGYELQGSDDGVSFRTPLATLHKFNGWADKFLTTPGAGLRDIYASVGYTVPTGSALGGTSMQVIYHDFQSDAGSLSYGSEWNFVVRRKLTKHISAEVKAAFYNADGFATDTDKIWFALTAKF